MRDSVHFARAHLSAILGVKVKSKEMGYERVARRSLPSVAEEARPEPVEGAGGGVYWALFGNVRSVCFETHPAGAPQQRGSF